MLSVTHAAAQNSGTLVVALRVAPAGHVIRGGRQRRHLSDGFYPGTGIHRCHSQVSGPTRAQIEGATLPIVVLLRHAPGVSMTYRQTLTELAAGQYGYVTTAEANQLNVPTIELGKLSSRGKLNHVARGVYRVPEIPVSDKDQFFEAVLRVGDGAHLVRDAVLALHGLGLVSPRRIKVGTPRRVRAVLPPFVEAVLDNTDVTELTAYEGIPSTTVARAIIDSCGLEMTERLQQALRDAVRDGLVTRLEQRKVRAALRKVQ